MRPRIVGNLDSTEVMVCPPVQAWRVEIECLFRRMRDKGRRKHGLKAAPLLILFVPGRQFLDLDVGMRQDEWRRQMVPDGKAAKEYEVQFVRERFLGVMLQCLVRVAPGPQNVALG